MRSLKQKDLLQISEIEKAVFSDPWSYEMLKSSSQHYRCWVLESKGNDLILGYLIGEKILDEFSIYNLAIHPEFQNQGMGSVFVQEVIDAMIKEGCKKFFLEVRKSNLTARSLYQKLGFKDVYIRKYYYSNPREDALVMMREISGLEEGNDENL